MARFWKGLRCSLLLLPFLVFADSPHGIELSVDEQDYFPGDVILIHAQMRRSDFAEFELHVPAHPQLYFVAHTVEPLQYANGEYTQNAHLLLQTMTSGTFRLESITADIKQGERLQQVDLPPFAFSVKSYDSTDASNELELLIPNTEKERSGFFALAITLLVGILSSIAFWKFRRKPLSDVVEVTPYEDPLSELRERLECDETPIDLIERLLQRSPVSLSPELRHAMEAAVYGNRLNKDALIRLLKKEASK